MLAGTVVSLIVVAIAVFERFCVIRACGGEYIYPIDDTYIHIAMGRNLAEHFMWGVQLDKLAFCSSSPLWTLLLGGLYCVFGVSEFLPWLLSLCFNVATAFVVCRTLSRLDAPVWIQAAGSLGVMLAGPFVPTTALGMEHAMHAFFLVSALAAAAEVPNRGRRFLALACLLAAAATATRYESLFVLLPLGCFVCCIEELGSWRQRGRLTWPWKGVSFVVAAVLPVVAYGIWALSQGGHFLPNSLMLKGSFLSLTQVFLALFGLFESVKEGYGFLYVLMLALVVVAALPKTAPYWRLASVAMVVAICGQMVFAQVGQLCRYEAFLTTAGVFVVLAALAPFRSDAFPRACAVLSVLLALAGVFMPRALASFVACVRGSTDICNQQVLMTRILAELPEEDRGCVALNDLGYMALHGGFDFLDVWGLGSQDMADANMKHPGRLYREDFLKLFAAHGVRYVVVFDKWYPLSLMPDGVVDVGTMTLKDNTVCGDDTVVFRATSEEAAAALARHLVKYQDKMPPRVRLWVRNQGG